MLAGPERVIELVKRSPISQGISDNLRLSRNQHVILAISDKDRAGDLVVEPIQGVGSELTEPVEGRQGMEGEEALVDEPAEARGFGGVEPDLVQLVVEDRFAAALEELYQRRGDVGLEGRL